MAILSHKFEVNIAKYAMIVVLRNIIHRPSYVEIYKRITYSGYDTDRLFIWIQSSQYPDSYSNSSLSDELPIFYSTNNRQRFTATSDSHSDRNTRSNLDADG